MKSLFKIFSEAKSPLNTSLQLLFPFFKKGKILIQGKKSSRAGRKKAPHFEVVAQKEGYKESQKGKKVVAQKDGYKVLTQMF